MAAQLGVGTRVMVGWAPARNFVSRFDVRLQRGVIVRGPYDLKDGDRFLGSSMVGGRYWSVDVDGHVHLTHESMIVPIDDGDPPSTRVDEELEVTA